MSHTPHNLGRTLPRRSIVPCALASACGVGLLAGSLALGMHVAETSPAETGLYLLLALFLGIPGLLYLALAVMALRRRPWPPGLAGAAAVVPIGVAGTLVFIVVRFNFLPSLGPVTLPVALGLLATHVLALASLESACRRNAKQAGGFEASAPSSHGLPLSPSSTVPG